jgi:small subunit ribosomal protein S8
MSMQFPLADMFCRIRNGQMAKKASVAMPSSKLKVSVAKILKEEGYVGDYVVKKDGAKAALTIQLKYHDGRPVIEEITSTSSPGLRSYASREEFPKVRNGLGVAIVSTSKGVMTARAAQAAGVGGEVLCTVF